MPTQSTQSPVMGRSKSGRSHREPQPVSMHARPGDTKPSCDSMRSGSLGSLCPSRPNQAYHPCLVRLHSPVRTHDSILASSCPFRGCNKQPRPQCPSFPDRTGDALLCDDLFSTDASGICCAVQAQRWRASALLSHLDKQRALVLLYRPRTRCRHTHCRTLQLHLIHLQLAACWKTRLLACVAVESSFACFCMQANCDEASPPLVIPVPAYLASPARAACPHRRSSHS